MRRFVAVQLCAALLLAAACGEKKPVDEMDAGEPLPEYEGEAGGNPPGFLGEFFDAGDNTPIDAGEAQVDTRCCNLAFRIDTGTEPGDAVGTLIGEVPPLSTGVPLTRVDGGYVAGACFPMTASSYYFYQFEYLSDDAGSGGLSQGDGGYLVTERRYSPLEPHYSVGAERQNFIPSVMNCAELDAGQGP